MEAYHDHSNYNFVLNREEASDLSVNPLETQLLEPNSWRLHKMVKLQVGELKKVKYI